MASDDYHGWAAADDERGTLPRTAKTAINDERRGKRGAQRRQMITHPRPMATDNVGPKIADVGRRRRPTTDADEERSSTDMPFCEGLADTGLAPDDRGSIERRSPSSSACLGHWSPLVLRPVSFGATPPLQM